MPDDYGVDDEWPAWLAAGFLILVILGLIFGDTGAVLEMLATSM